MNATTRAVDTTTTTTTSRIVKVKARDMGGRYKSEKNVNNHTLSHERGDNTARSLGFTVALTLADCEAWGLPFVAEHESGRGIRLKDARTRLGDGVSVKSTERSDPNKDTSHVLTTTTEGEIPTSTAAIMKGCPVLVVAHQGTIDLDRVQYRLLDARAVLVAAGGDLAHVPDRTGMGHPGRGGSGPIWGKWVQRKDAHGEKYGHYWEVSVSVSKIPWRWGTIEEIEAEIHAMLHP